MLRKRKIIIIKKNQKLLWTQFQCAALWWQWRRWWWDGPEWKFMQIESNSSWIDIYVYIYIRYLYKVHTTQIDTSTHITTNCRRHCARDTSVCRADVGICWPMGSFCNMHCSLFGSCVYQKHRCNHSLIRRRQRRPLSFHRRVYLGQAAIENDIQVVRIALQWIYLCSMV